MLAGRIVVWASGVRIRTRNSILEGEAEGNGESETGEREPGNRPMLSKASVDARLSGADSRTDSLNRTQ